MAVTLRVKNLDRMADSLRKAAGTRPSVRFGLNITGPAAAYALVWEFGRVGIKPGPKTTWGTNPDGERVVLTKTAPRGYIRVNRAKYRKFVREEMKKIQWSRMNISQVRGAVEWALQKAAARCADLIADTAPYDTGDLRSAIRAVKIVGPGRVSAVEDKMTFRVPIAG